MSIEFIEKRRQQQRDQATAAQSRYSQLLRKTASSKLSKAEDAELDNLIPSLGKSLEVVEAEATVCRQVLDLEPVAGAFSQRRAAVAGLLQEKQTAEAELRAAVTAAEIAYKSHPVWQRMVAADRDLKKADEARQSLVELKQRHWRLLGIADPATAPPKCHLLQYLFKRDYGDLEHDRVEFELMMADPTKRNLGDCEIVPAIPADEHVVLMEQHAALCQSPLVAMYLMNITDTERVQRGGFVIYADDHAPIGNSIHADQFHWCRPPGYSADQHQQNVRLIEKRIAAAAKEIKQQTPSRNAYVGQ